MPINAATLNIGIGVTGEGAAAAALQKVDKAAAAVGDKVGKAARTASNFGASMAQAGTLGATSLAGIAQQAGEIIASFGPEGAIVGAIATTTIAIGTLFFKAQKEMEEFQRSVRKLVAQSSFTGLQARYDDLQFDIGEAKNDIAALKAIESLGGANAVLARAQRVKAEYDLNRLLEKRTYLVPKLQQAAVETGERQALALRFQREEAEQAERETRAQKAAADAIRDKAQAHKDLEAANAALDKASEGITLGGPGVDRGLGNLENAPTIPVQVAPIFSVDNASILALQEQIADILESEFNNRRLAVNLEFAEFGQNVVGGLANSLGEAAGHGFKNAGGIILGALGGIFKQMGSALIAYGVAMKALLPHLLNPFTSGGAAIAAGVLLVAVGTALSGLATGAGGGGSGGGFSSNVGEVTQAAQVTNITVGASGTQRTAAGVTPIQPITFNVFGENDPVAQRVLVNTLDNARRRGL